MLRLVLILYFSFFISAINANEIVNKKAKLIAESSKVFILNFAMDELNKKIHRDMQEPYIKAIVIHDHFMKEIILSSYKKNGLILQKKTLPDHLKNLPKVDVDIIQKNKHEKTVISTLSLYYDPSFLSKKEQNQVVFTKEEEKYLESKKTIRFCINPNFFPLESIDKEGNYVGIGADVLEIVQKNSDIKFELVKTKNWTESLKYIKKNKCDILPLAMKTKEHSSYLNFTNPYINFPFVVLTNHSEIFIDNISELFDKKISVVKDSPFMEILKKEFPQIKIVEVDDLKKGIKSVRKKKVFAHIDALAPLVYTLQKEGITNVKIAGKLEKQLSLSIASRKDQATLQTIMQKTIQSIATEDIQRIENKWLAINFEEKMDLTLLYQILVIFSIILAIALWRYLEIKKINAIILEKNEELSKAYEKVSLLAVTDRLTNLYNRHKLDEILQVNKELSDRYNDVFGVLLIDVDYFKQINDTYGHLRGDKVLKSLANIIRTSSRKTDTVGRWGGEEFLIITPNVTKESILVFAENLRTIIEKSHFEGIEKLTISIGVSIYENNESCESLISKADKALYASKEGGRNCINFL